LQRGYRIIVHTVNDMGALWNAPWSTVTGQVGQDEGQGLASTHLVATKVRPRAIYDCAASQGT
jgi:hypothetical protein